MNELPPAERKIAMVFQSYALYPHMNVYKNMAFGLKFAKTDKAEVDRRVRQAAEILQLDAAARRASPRELSGGQRQRVAIGRAIVREPERLPLRRAALESRRGAPHQHADRDRQAAPDAQAATMIYVTHDQVEAMTLADKIVVMNQGQIEQIGAPLDLYHHPANLFVAGFIGSPRMNLIKASVLHVDRAGITVSTITGRETTIAVAPGSAKAGDALTLGIRPEHMIEGGASGLALSGTVDAVERLGEFELHLSPSRRRHRHHRALARRQPRHSRHAPHSLSAKRGDPRLRQLGEGDAAAALA